MKACLCCGLLVVIGALRAPIWRPRYPFVSVEMRGGRAALGTLLRAALVPKWLTVADAVDVLRCNRLRGHQAHTAHQGSATDSLPPTAGTAECSTL